LLPAYSPFSTSALLKLFFEIVLKEKIFNPDGISSGIELFLSLPFGEVWRGS
jgi:hypothetical protein